jgi:hypothetical protein
MWKYSLSSELCSVIEGCGISTLFWDSINTPIGWLSLMRPRTKAFSAETKLRLEQRKEQVQSWTLESVDSSLLPLTVRRACAKGLRLLGYASTSCRGCVACKYFSLVSNLIFFTLLLGSFAERTHVLNFGDVLCIDFLKISISWCGVTARNSYPSPWLAVNTFVQVFFYNFYVLLVFILH